MTSDNHTQRFSAVVLGTRVSVNPNLVEVIIGSLDVKWILTWSLFPATVTGAGGAPPAVVV